MKMISRQAVLEYLNKHPNYSAWQMRLHFLQASRQPESQSPISIGSIANQLNYILRDLEAIGTISPRQESGCLDPQTQSLHQRDSYRQDYVHIKSVELADREQNN
jgi:hypothetical protein